jgi:hypothetical protein
MPKFFVPAAADSTKAEEVYADLRSRAEKMRGGPMSERRIFRIDFRHNGNRHYSEVGRPDSQTKYLVPAIFEDHNKNLYLTVTAAGNPMVNSDSVLSIEDFA